MSGRKLQGSSVIYYVFRPCSLVSDAIHAEWKMIYEHMQRLPNPKHVTLWCAVPPGVWAMDAVTITMWSTEGSVVSDAE